MLVFLDGFYTVLHLIVIIFNLFGWVWEKTRRIHRNFLLATWGSWLGLGLKYGLGYCFLTDWHWDVKRRLGVEGLPNSFIHYLFNEIGINISAAMVDWITGVSISIVTCVTAVIWIRDIRNKED
jgi:hypothetical protein